MQQKVAQHVQFWLSTVLLFVADRTRSVTDRDRSQDRDRGDVPGWVMITVMTAIVVVALLAVFEPAVKDAVTNAFSSVTGKNK